jgi:hypothetical protein
MKDGWMDGWIDRLMRGDLLGELAYWVMEHEKSHNRLSASWRPWNAGGMAQSKSESLKTWETNGANLSLRPEI